MIRCKSKPDNCIPFSTNLAICGAAGAGGNLAEEAQNRNESQTMVLNFRNFNYLRSAEAGGSLAEFGRNLADIYAELARLGRN